MTIKDYCLQISKLLEGRDNHEKSKAFIQLGKLYITHKKEVLSNIKIYMEVWAHLTIWYYIKTGKLILMLMKTQRIERRFV